MRRTEPIEQSVPGTEEEGERVTVECAVCGREVPEEDAIAAQQEEGEPPIFVCSEQCRAELWDSPEIADDVDGPVG